MSDNQNPKKLISSDLLSPSPSLDSDQAATSPTSILEPKAFSSNIIRTTPRNQSLLLPHWDINVVGTKAVGLGIVGALINQESDDQNSSINQLDTRRRILLGTKLKVQIPSARTSSSVLESLCNSPFEFGIKTKEMQLALYNSPAHPTSNNTTTPKSTTTTLFTGSLSPREMELSEDYTCVIIHGPNPKMTHIFDNCIIESCGERSFGSRKYNYEEDVKPPVVYPSDDFLSHCGTCKKKLALGEDIFIYKGEKGFCSEECRSEGMMLMEDDEDERGAEKGLDDHGDDCFL